MSKKQSTTVQKKVTNQYETRTGEDWKPEEEALLFELKAIQGLPYSIISLELKRTSESCKSKWRRTTWETKPFYDNTRVRIKQNMKVALAQRISDANDRRISVRHMATEILADRIEDAVVALPNVKKEVYKFSKKSGQQKHLPEDVGLVLSDAHIGHHHSLSETGGISEYNFEIFKKRVEFLKTAITDIVELHSQLYSLPNLHIFCPGDIVAGMNAAGNWSSTYINMPIVDQAVAGTDAISDMIYYWLGLFENINFYGVYGNHGRCASKGVEKEYVNWDYVCYKFLKERFSDNSRVNFVVPDAWWLMETIRNHKFLLLHGDNARNIKSLEAVSERMASITGCIPNYTIAGHFHTATDFSTNFGRVILNGSFVGGDIYSLKELVRSSRPVQKMFGIHDKRGITWTYDLDLSIAR